MDNIYLLFVCLFLGILLQKSGAFPEKTPIALNQFVIYISLPALAFIYIPSVSLNVDVLYPVMVSWIIMGAALLVIPLVAKIFRWDRATVGCLLLTAGLGNTSFVGFPVIEALYGDEGLRYALLVDQPGSFVVVCTIGIWVASRYSSGSITWYTIIRKVLTFPPFIAFLVALGLNIANWQADGAILSILERLGATVTPLALTSVGMQLRLSYQGVSLKALVAGLSFKLLFAPALIFFLYIMVLGASGTIIKVSVMEAAMAPMITGSILAITYGLQPKLAALMVGIGVPVAFITLAGWYLLLEYVL